MQANRQANLYTDFSVHTKNCKTSEQYNAQRMLVLLVLRIEIIKAQSKHPQSRTSHIIRLGDGKLTETQHAIA